MSVTGAAKILGVTRVALSNLLNGRASLSRQMALRLKTAFGADANELLRYQDDALRGRRREEDQKLTIRSYVPPFLKITASQIHEWADKGDEARSRLPVLLRRLIRSTGDELRGVDFPGFGEAQRHGWDGQVEARRATPWIPEGKSGWELSTRQNSGVKANDDFCGPRSKLPEHTRAETTFVFVSSRKWPGKTDWEEARKAEGSWKDVRALDASDLEQWLEESIEGQVWLAEELGLPSMHDCMTLDRAWQRWREASEPPMTEELFRPAVTENCRKVVSWLEAETPERPLYVAADSKDEALAFLACVLRAESVPVDLPDRTVVVNSAQTLKLLAPSTSRFIPIVAGKEAERELAALYRRRPCIVVRPRNAVDQEPDVGLGLLRYDTFQTALLAMGLARDGIDRHARVSGRSPTVLRRRLSKVSAIREPWWAEKAEVARKLVPMVLIGAWHAESKADQEVLGLLADKPSRQVEEDVAAFLVEDDSPVWSVDQHRGVVSKFDGLFAIGRYMTSAELRCFLVVARNVLSEADPALALPRDQRWLAKLDGKVRDHSNALRTGVCETLVLLAAHGNDLSPRRLGLDLETEVASLFRRLLRPDGDKVPLTTETLESYERDLPMLAEAAPEEFLSLVESDLESEDSAVRRLLRPVETDIFTGCPRAGLLWGLECLAWNPSSFSRVVLILAELAKTRIDDNYVLKPIHSLEAVFQSGAPQTAAPLDRRVEALKLLRRRVPDVAWHVCMKEVREDRRDDNYRPRWRGDAAGAGRDVPREEAEAFVRAALRLSLSWPDGHDASKLGDLIDRLVVMSDVDGGKVWSLVDDWMADQRIDSERAELRERLRRFGYATTRPVDRVEPTLRKRAKVLYDRLAPDDPAARHEWLFAERWIHDWPEDAADAEDFLGREERVEERRRVAMNEVWSSAGLSGALALLPSSSAPDIVGRHAAFCVTDINGRIEILQSCLSDDEWVSLDPEDRKLDGFLQGFIQAVGEDTRVELLARVAADLTEAGVFRLLLYAPFGGQTWRIVRRQGQDLEEKYWGEVEVPLIGRFSASECVELLDGLLEAARPFAAFNLVSRNWDAVETSRLVRLLRALIAARERDAPVEQGMFSFYISRALKSLDGRTGVSRDELADLEFEFSVVLRYEERGTPYLERRIAESPGYFVWLVSRVYRRADGDDDPEGWPAADSERGRYLYRLASSALEKAGRVPGTEENGEIDSEKLRAWIWDVRRLAAEVGRVQRAEICVGELLARKQPVEDRAWPERPICEALEAVATRHIGSGFSTGAINARGYHRRGSVGDESDGRMASRYRAWADTLAGEYPFVIRALESIARFYEDSAAHWASDEELQMRLRN